MLESEGRVQLGKVLDACQERGEDAECIGPGLEMFGLTSDEDKAGGESREGMDNADSSDEDSGEVGGVCSGGFRGREGRGTWEEEQEEEQSVSCGGVRSRSVQVGGEFMGR